MHEDQAIEKSKKTSQAKKMSAGISQTTPGSGGASRPGGMKGPTGSQSQGGKKAGRVVSKSLGVPSTKAKRPGGK